MKTKVILLTFISSLLFSCATKQEQLEGVWLIATVDGKDVSKEDVKLNLGKDGVAVIASKGIVGTWLLTSDESTLELRESRRKKAEELKIITLTSEELVVVAKGDTNILKKVKE